MGKPPSGDLITIDELAKTLRVSRNTAYSMVRTAVIPGFKIGRQWRVQMKDVDRYISNSKFPVQRLAGGEDPLKDLIAKQEG